jgi:hypothetical protein
MNQAAMTGARLKDAAGVEPLTQLHRWDQQQRDQPAADEIAILPGHKAIAEDDPVRLLQILDRLVLMVGGICVERNDAQDDGKRQQSPKPDARLMRAC